MNDNIVYATGISLLFHGIAVILFFLLAANMPLIRPALVINFSLVKTKNDAELSTAQEKKNITVTSQKEEHIHKIQRPAIQPISPVIEKTEKDKPDAKKPLPRLITRSKSKRRIPMVKETAKEEEKPLSEPVLPQVSSQVVAFEETQAEDSQQQLDIPTVVSQNEEIVAVSEVQSSPPAERIDQILPSSKELYYTTNYARIREDIQLNTSYPPIARRMGWEGKVVVSFTVLDSGLVEDIRILKSCGFKALDQNAIKTIKRCVPFPKPPAPAEFTLPITYKLK